MTAGPKTAIRVSFENEHLTNYYAFLLTASPMMTTIGRKIEFGLRIGWTTASGSLHRRAAPFLCCSALVNFHSLILRPLRCCRFALLFCCQYFYCSLFPPAANSVHFCRRSFREEQSGSTISLACFHRNIRCSHSRSCYSRTRRSSQSSSCCTGKDYSRSSGCRMQASIVDVPTAVPR